MEVLHHRLFTCEPVLQIKSLQSTVQLYTDLAFSGVDAAYSGVDAPYHRVISLSDTVQAGRTFLPR